MYGEYPIIPNNGDEFSQLTAKAEQFIDNLNNIPLKSMSANANTLMVEVTQTAQELQEVSQSLDNILSQAEHAQVSAELSRTLQGITALTKDLSSGSTCLLYTSDAADE